MARPWATMPRGRWNVWKRADEAAIAKAAVNGDPCVADVMNLESPWAPYLAYWFSLGASCDPDQTGVADVTAYNDTSENWPVVDGYGALVAAWGADVPVTLNAAAERIRVTRDGVHVATAQGAVRGRTALVTVSTAMLASGRIAFEPGLPDWKLAAIRELPLGVHNRIAVMLDGLPPDPGDRCAMTVMTRDDEVPMALDVAPYGHAYVVGLTGGRFGAWLERTGQGARVGRLCRRACPDRLGIAGRPKADRSRDRDRLAWRPVDAGFLFGGGAGSGAPARGTRAPRSTIASSSRAKPPRRISSRPATAPIFPAVAPSTRSTPSCGRTAGPAGRSRNPWR